MTRGENLKDLYRRTVLDHSRHPRNFRRLENPDREAEGHNPLCGDKIHVYLKLADQHLAELAYEAAGCAISLASASMMSEQLAGLAVKEAEKQAEGVLEAFADRSGELELPGGLSALGGVRDYPSRVRCALLPWRTLCAALEQDQRTVSTEPGS